MAPDRNHEPIRHPTQTLHPAVTAVLPCLTAVGAAPAVLGDVQVRFGCAGGTPPVSSEEEESNGRSEEEDESNGEEEGRAW